MRRWRVFGVAAFLPLLLQLALLLFFTRLGLFLHDLDAVVGWVTTSLMLTWLALFLSMTIMPMFSAQCPYKTPMLNRFLLGLRIFWVSISCGILTRMWSLLPPICHHRHYSVPYPDPTGNWKERLYRSVKGWKDTWEAYEEEKVSKERSLDIFVVLCALRRGYATR